MIPEGLITRACKEGLDLDSVPKDLNEELTASQRRALYSYLDEATDLTLPALQFSPAIKSNLNIAMWLTLVILIACSYLSVSKGFSPFIFLSALGWLVAVLAMARALSGTRSYFIHSNPEELEKAIHRMNGE